MTPILGQNLKPINRDLRGMEKEPQFLEAPLHVGILYT